MHHLLRSLIMAAGVLSLAAGSQAAEPAKSDSDRLKDSLAKWEKLREGIGGDYSYSVRWTSFVGFGNVTTITIRGNKVVERKFEVIEPGQPPQPPKLKWVEEPRDLGSHKNEGAPVRTVDEMYAEARKLVEGKHPETHRLSLGFDANGLLSYCFLVDRRIADDAPKTGIAPFQIQWKPRK